MSDTAFHLRGVDDPRLAVHATSNRPVWLWSVDGTRVLWANPIGARLFGARSGADLTAKSFGPADPHRRQMAQLSGRLPPGGAVRLERLRGFGAPLGRLMTCACARLDFADGGTGILVVAAEAAGRVMPLVERLRNLVEGIDTPIAAFARDGAFIGASEAARVLLGFHDLADAGLDAARDGALKDGRVETPIGIGRMVLQRVGSGADVGLVALIAPGAERQSLLQQPDVSEKPAPESEPDSFAAVEHDDTPVAHDDDTPVADKPSTEAEPVAEETVDAEPVADQPAADDAVAEEPARTRPLRFTWRIDADGHFSISSDEFIHLIGAPIAAALGRRWTDIATAFDLDPDGRVVKAVATRRTWSGITVSWPVSWPADGGERLAVELSGLPVTDRDHNFSGYRGFGICRDLNQLTQLAAQRRAQARGHPPRLSADIAQAGPAGDKLDAGPAGDEPDDPDPVPTETPNLEATEPSPPATPDIIVEQSKNVVQLRPVDPKSPALTPVENRAFNELARQLSARLEKDTEPANDAAPTPADPETADQQTEQPDETASPPERPTASDPAPGADRPDWLATPAAPARGEWLRDRTLLDLLPVGVLIYRLDRLLYANTAFLARTRYPTLHALEEAGGLDALYVEPDVSRTSSTSDGGTAVKISATEATDAPAFQPADARLFTISWDDEPALALIFASDRAEPAATGPAVMAVEPSPAGHANAEELAAILDTTADGIIMFDAEGRINSCNRSAEALFGHDGETLTRLNLVDLFAPESQRVVGDYLDGIKGAGVASLLDHGREALGRVHAGGFIPLSLMMGRTRQDGPNFFAVFRDLSQAKKTETELLNARRQAERAATAKADVLARISHEVRTPLNAIIGFAEVMTEERFGPLGNERYVDYMKDIRVSGERVIAIINDLLDLSRIETGKLDLAFTSQNLNEIVEQCVAVMQPQANRGRIIIRTSLAHLLPTVIADTRALRQIALNLIANSIHLANAGGQVIVSTALTDFGEVVLRVRDTGHGMNDNELAAAMEPFRAPAPADRTIDGAGVNLSLTKALVEANRARFQIKTAPSSGTLIEVVFSHAAARV